MNNVSSLKDFVVSKGYSIVSETPLNGGLQIQLVLDGNIIINFYPTTGKFNVQGKRSSEKDLFHNLLKTEFTDSEKTKKSNKVFIIYGHDESALNDLERLLRKWGLEPIILSQQPNDGFTLIEKLEKYTEEVCCAIALVTPDDIGYKRGFEDAKKPRARQNVIFEFGLLVGKLGRKAVIVLREKTDNFEFLSDVDGVVYIQYEEKVEKSSVELFRNLNRFVYIDSSKL